MSNNRKTRKTKNGGYGNCVSDFAKWLFGNDAHPGDVVVSRVILQTPPPVSIPNNVAHLTRVNGPPTLLIPVAVDGWRQAEVNTDEISSGNWLYAHKLANGEWPVYVYSDIITCQDYKKGRTIRDGGYIDARTIGKISQPFSLPMRHDIADLCPENGFNPVYYVSSNKHHDYLRYNRFDGDVWPSWYTKHYHLCCDDNNGRGTARFQDLGSCAPLATLGNNVGEFDNVPDRKNPNKITLDQRGRPKNLVSNHDYTSFVNRLDDCGYKYDDVWDGKYRTKDHKPKKVTFFGGYMDCLDHSAMKCFSIYLHQDLNPCLPYYWNIDTQKILDWLNDPLQYYLHAPPDYYYPFRQCLISGYDTDAPVDDHLEPIRVKMEEQ